MRPRIAINVQLVFAVVILANVVRALVLGGAVLARYMLPVVPLVICCVSTLRRRVRRWTWWIAFTCAAFVVQLFVPPPYRIAPEDTLLYRDYVILHKLAADELSARYPHARVLTAWPASDELTRPFLGYVKQPLARRAHRKLLAAGDESAAQATDQFDVALLFTTKWEPAASACSRPALRKEATGAFFDYHEDLSPLAAANSSAAGLCVI